jgi:hypothetical protein
MSLKDIFSDQKSSFPKNWNIKLIYHIIPKGFHENSPAINCRAIFGCPFRDRIFIEE